MSDGNASGPVPPLRLLHGQRTADPLVLASLAPRRQAEIRIVIDVTNVTFVSG